MSLTEDFSIGAMAAHRPRFEFTALHATVLVAALMHAVLLFTYTTFCIDAGSSEYSFFDDVKLVQEHATVTLTTIAPAPTPPPRVQGPEVPRVAARQPALPNPNPKPPAPPKSRHPGPTQHAPRRSRVTDVPPPVVAHDNGTGPAVPVGHGTGAKGGDPKGTGVGDGGAQTDDGPPPADGGGGGGKATISAPDWNNFTHLGIPEPPADVGIRASESKDWEQLADVLGLDKGKLFSKELVEPYCLGQTNPELNNQYASAMQGKVGEVTIICKLGADGKPNASIIPSGDEVLDTVAFNIGRCSLWLPALRYGKPVDYEFRYKVTFSLVQR